jgi:hypothetical protein
MEKSGFLPYPIIPFYFSFIEEANYVLIDDVHVEELNRPIIPTIPLSSFETFAVIIDQVSRRLIPTR